MKRSTKLLITIFGLFFATIFYKQAIGLNLFLYNAVLLFLLIKFTKVFDLKNKLHLAVLLGASLTAIGVLIHASAWVITMNIISLVLLFGIINNRDSKILLNVVIAAVYQFFAGTFLFFTKNQNKEKTKHKSKIRRWIGPSLIIITVLIIFCILYSLSSSKFDSIFGFVGRFVQDVLSHIFKYISFSFILLLCSGFIIACAYFVKTVKINGFTEPDTDTLHRFKQSKSQNPDMKLLTEFRTAVIMFALLNILLLTFNVIDIWYVWINFTWDGELLKEFVHEGTYILIFTLFISVGLVLFFFRSNLNFFSKNKPLKILANIWLIQNMIMAVSVLIRNIHYINYYNLAYLRIGVVLFLIIVFLGLVSVLVKINTTKNIYYLLRVNTLFAYMTLIVFSLADWDVIIAKFNFSRSDTAFVHLNFMVQLTDKALPYLDKSESEIRNNENSPVFERIGKKEYFMKPAEYSNIINTRKSDFLAEYPEHSWLEWNYADYKAYQLLRK